MNSTLCQWVTWLGLMVPPLPPLQNLPALQQVQIIMGDHTLHVQVARDEADLRRGLKYRTWLSPDSGLLLVLPHGGNYCVWMEDTKIPLSVAFLDAGGQVTNLSDMEPGSLQKHCADSNTRYVLEVNRGILTAAGVTHGSLIKGLPLDQ